MLRDEAFGHVDEEMYVSVLMVEVEIHYTVKREEGKCLGSSAVVSWVVECCDSAEVGWFGLAQYR